MQGVVGAPPGEVVIHGQVDAAAIEGLLADLGMRTDGAAAYAPPGGIPIAVAFDDGRHGGVEGIPAG